MAEQQKYNEGGYELINSRWNAPAPTAAEVALQREEINVPSSYFEGATSVSGVKRIEPAVIEMTGFEASIAAAEAAEKKEANRLIAVEARRASTAAAMARLAVAR